MRRCAVQRMLLLVAVVALLLKADLGHVSRSALFIYPSGQHLRLGGLNVNYELITKPGVSDRGMFYLRVFRRDGTGMPLFHAGLNVVRLSLVMAAGCAAAVLAVCVRRRGASGTEGGDTTGRCRLRQSWHSGSKRATEQRLADGPPIRSGWASLTKGRE
jgi:hypothetical protein